MKYLENNDFLGIMPAADSVAAMIMENLGVSHVETPNIVSVGDELFGLSPELTAIEDTLCIKLEELDSSIFEAVKDNPELTEYIEFEEENYQFGDLVESEDGDIYVSLLPETVEESEESDDYVLEVGGKTYEVVDDEENSETFAYLAEDEEGEYYLVDSEEEATNIVYLNEVE